MIFNDFHNQVLNLSRDSFSNFDLMKVKSIAEYIYLIEDEFPPDGLRLIEIYVKILICPHLLVHFVS